MEQIAKDFIEKKHQELDELKLKEKQDFLEKQGLSTVEYTDERAFSDFSEEEKEKYPHIEGEFGTFKRYRVIYPEISDEDFCRMKEAQEAVDAQRLTVGGEPEEKEKNRYSSRLALVLFAMGIAIYLGAFFAGVIFANKEVEVAVGKYYTYTRTEKQFDFAAALIWWVSGLAAGTMMLGFAHIVEHLKRQTALLSRIEAKRRLR